MSTLNDLNDLASGYNLHAAELGVARAVFLARPSVMLGARVSLRKDGNQWGAVLDNDLPESVAGFGDTPDAAMAAFDKVWSEP